MGPRRSWPTTRRSRRSHGANTTTPSPAVAAPLNLLSVLMVDAIDGASKVCVVGSHNPTQSALSGGKHDAVASGGGVGKLPETRSMGN